MALTAKETFEALGSMQTISGFDVFTVALDRYTAADHRRIAHAGDITTNASDMVQVSVLFDGTDYTAVPQICSQGLTTVDMDGLTFIGNYWAK